MTLERAKQLPGVQAGFGGFYNANSAKLILSEVNREHGQTAVDTLIAELELGKNIEIQARHALRRRLGA